MSPYGLREKPKPSKRMLEASEVADEMKKSRKRKKTGLEELESTRTPQEGEAVSTSLKNSNAQMQGSTTIEGSSDSTTTVTPLKWRPEVDTSSRTARKIKAKQPATPKKATIVVKSDSTQETQIEESVVPKDSNNAQLQTSNIISSSIVKAHLAPDASIRAHLENEHQPVKRRAGAGKKRPTVQPVNLRPLSTSRDYRLAPDGKARDVDPANLPVPTTLYTPFPPSPTKKRKHPSKRKPNRKINPLPPKPSSTNDIVSGDKPSNLSSAEEECAKSDILWQQESLPDQTGKFWKCIKMIGKDFQEDVGWKRGGTTKSGASAEEEGDISPGSAREDFEREVELFLSACEEELPGWGVLEDDDELDFGED